MSDKMQDVLQWRADLLMAGHCTQLAEQFVYPAILHSDVGTRTVRDRAEMVVLLEAARADWKQRGVSRIRIDIQSVSETRHGRFQVRSLYHELGATGWLIGQLNSILHFMHTPRGLRMAMTETTRSSAAATWPQDGGQAVAGG